MNTARIAPALLLLAAGIGLPAAAWASGPVPAKAAHATAHAPATGASAPVNPAAAQGAGAAAAADPMEQLRKRLAERLAGRPASPGTATQDIRVTAKAAPPSTAAAPVAEPVAPSKAGGAAQPAKPAAANPATVHAAAAAVAPAPLAAVAPAPAHAQAPLARPPAKAQVVQAPAAAVVPVAAHLVAPPVLKTEPSQAPHAAASPRPARPKAASPTTTAHAPAAHGNAVHWDYNGPAGPQTWGGLRPEFSLCGTGQRQSPIDVRGGLAVDLEPVRFEYQSSRFSVIDNGHTVQVSVAPGNAIHLGGKRFELQQFHFHRPSEERIDGRQFEMSAHLVHKDDQGRLAVVTILLDKGPPQPAVQKVWNNLPLEKNEDVPARVALDVNELLPTDQRYYTYMGSLTTPPCTEGVQWVIMRQPVTMSPEQIELFARIYPMNARPVQQIAGRRILQSN